MTLSRRDWLRITAGASAAFALEGCGPSDGGDEGEGAPAPDVATPTGSPATLASGRTPSGILTRQIPSSGEQIPVIGLGVGDKDVVHRRASSRLRGVTLPMPR